MATRWRSGVLSLNWSEAAGLLDFLLLLELLLLLLLNKLSWGTSSVGHDR